jgi:hypothetical protein
MCCCTVSDTPDLLDPLANGAARHLVTTLAIKAASVVVFSSYRTVDASTLEALASLLVPVSTTTPPPTSRGFDECVLTMERLEDDTAPLESRLLWLILDSELDFVMPNGTVITPTAWCAVCTASCSSLPTLVPIAVAVVHAWLHRGVAGCASSCSHSTRRLAGDTLRRERRLRAPSASHSTRRPL